MQYLDLLWLQARPSTDPDAWIVRQVLGEPLTQNLRSQVLSAVIRPVDDLDEQDLPHNAARYLNRWNAARSDLLSDYVLSLDPEPLPPARDVQNQPRDDYLHWLWFSVAGLDLPPDRASGGNLLRALREIRFPNEPTLDGFHRQRYLVYRFFWDAHFHEL